MLCEEEITHLQSPFDLAILVLTGHTSNEVMCVVCPKLDFNLGGVFGVGRCDGLMGDF